MKKFKKIFAVLLTLAMVLGMSMTSFAANIIEDNNGATIKVKNLAKEATQVTVYQIVTWDAEENKLDVPEWAAAYLELDEKSHAYSIKGETADEKKTNWNLLKTAAETNDAPTWSTETSTGECTTPQFAMGWYLIQAAGETTSYNVMAVCNYDYSINNLITPKDVDDLVAKPDTYRTVKSFKDETKDAIVGRGDTIVYNVDTFIPLEVVEKEERSFVVWDEAKGLDITGVKVSVNSTEITAERDFTVAYSNRGEDSLVKNNRVDITFTNTYLQGVSAGDAVRVEVTAVATGNPDAGYSNKAGSTGTSDSSDVDSETGTLTIKKFDENNNPLSGATFSVYKRGNDDKSQPEGTQATKVGSAIQFVKESAGVYHKATAAEIADNTTVKATELSGNGAVIVVKGLDEGAYYVEEINAPNGYSVNIVPDNQQPTTIGKDNLNVESDVTDTKLNSLPSTGGIGTTIFTIGGCAIMIIAAALFFASRRKSSK